jgi:hypothetical protein
VSPSVTRRRPVRGARVRSRFECARRCQAGRVMVGDHAKPPGVTSLSTGSESLPPWKRGLPMGCYEVSVLKCCFVPLVRQWDGYLGPALRAGSLRVAPRRSASHLAAAGPSGPRLARRRASRPRWSRTPGRRGDAGHVTSAPRFIRRPSAGRAPAPRDHGAGTMGGCAAAVRPKLPGGDLSSPPERPRDRARLGIPLSALGRIRRWQPERRRRAVA